MEPVRAARSFRLRDAIEQEIVTGRFAPGDRLDEVTLAKRFEVSRTPVREALAQLVPTGIVEHIPHRGTFVAVRTPADLIQMFEVMAELEGMCGRLAARRVRVDELAEIRAANDVCTAAIDIETDEYYYANEAFHLAIYRASGNAFLEAQAIALHNRLKPYRRLQLRISGRVRSSHYEHQQIVEAITAGDSIGAEAAMKGHVLIQGERFSDFFAALSATGTRMA